MTQTYFPFKSFLVFALKPTKNCCKKTFASFIEKISVKEDNIDVVIKDVEGRLLSKGLGGGESRPFFSPYHWHFSQLFLVHVVHRSAKVQPIVLAKKVDGINVFASIPIINEYFHFRFFVHVNLIGS